MQRIIIRHLTGTRANQVEDFPLQTFRELLIGREANSNIKYDAEREDLVSRNHARIVRDPADPQSFLITDLDSRNGTFLNRQRVYGSAKLHHGDVIQIGAAGPEFAFEFDTPPAPRATRLSPESYHAAPPTREGAVTETVGPIPPGGAVPPGLTGAGVGAPPSRPVGRATVERMLGDVTQFMRKESGKTLRYAMLGLLVLLVAGAGVFLYQRQQEAKDRADYLAKHEALAKTLADISARQADALHREDSAQKEKQIIIERYKNPEKAAKSPEFIAADNKEKEAQKEVQASEHQAEDVNKQISLLKPPPGSQPAPPAPAPSPVPAAELTDLTPVEIHNKNLDSVVLIEVSWRLMDTATGGQIYLYHHKNPFFGRPVGDCRSVPPDTYLPVFASDGSKVFPVLSTLSNDGHNEGIVGSHWGTGFVASGDGFLLTNRHVLAPWRTRYDTRQFTKQRAGLLVMPQGGGLACISGSDFPEWVPSEGSPLVVDKMDSVQDRGGKERKVAEINTRLAYNPLHTSIEGAHVRLAVTFAKTKQRYAAQLVTVSDKADVALAKVEMPGGAKAVTLFSGDPDAIQPGQPITVMGYPAVSVEQIGVDVSRDTFNTLTTANTIADPTLTTGPISKVISDGSGIRGVDGVISSWHVYQLGLNTTGAGNSGGPVFDAKGRVIAIFDAGGSAGGAAVTWAVPIKYGLELIQNSHVIK